MKCACSWRSCRSIKEFTKRKTFGWVPNSSGPIKTEWATHSVYFTLFWNSGVDLYLSNIVQLTVDGIRQSEKMFAQLTRNWTRNNVLCRRQHCCHHHIHRSTGPTVPGDDSEGLGPRTASGCPFVTASGKAAGSSDPRSLVHLSTCHTFLCRELKFTENNRTGCAPRRRRAAGAERALASWRRVGAPLFLRLERPVALS